MTAAIDFNSDEARRRVVERREAAIRLARSKVKAVVPRRALSSEERDIIREAARLGEEWRARANLEG
jgi:hypothetical protein